MPRLNRLGDVPPSEPAPPREVFGRNQDAPIGPRSAAGTARQTVEVVVHSEEVWRGVAGAHAVDFGVEP